MEIFPLSLSSACRAVTSAGQFTTMPGGANSQIRIYNAGPNKVCVRSSDGAQLAVMPTDAAAPNGVGVVIPPNGVEPFTLPAGPSSLHAICAAGETAEIYFSVGVGG
jgi:hypothetical protein